MANFIPKLSTEATAESTSNIVAGQFIITTDGNNLYVDIDDSTRIKIDGGASGSASINKYIQTIGNGSSTSFTITHNLNTEDICVNGIDVATKTNTWLEYTIVDANNISIIFDSAPATNAIKIIVVG